MGMWRLKFYYFGKTTVRAYATIMWEGLRCARVAIKIFKSVCLPLFPTTPCGVRIEIYCCMYPPWWQFGVEQTLNCYLNIQTWRDDSFVNWTEGWWYSTCLWLEFTIAVLMEINGLSETNQKLLWPILTICCTMLVLVLKFYILNSLLCHMKM